MRIDISTLLLFLSIWAVLISEASAQDEKEIFEGESVTLACEIRQPIEHCSWKLFAFGKIGMNLFTQYPENYPSGYNITGDLQTGNCNLHIAAANSTDEGAWICTLPPTKEDQTTYLKVIVPPRKVYIAHDDMEIPSGGFKQVVTNSGLVKVDCVSVRSRPSPRSIHWTVNGEKIEGHMQHNNTKFEDDTITVQSYINLRFTPPENSLMYRFEPDPVYEKEVTCIVDQNSYTGPVSATVTFGRAYAPTKARLTPYGIPNDKSKILLVCEANGIPEPTYYIQKISSSTALPDAFIVNSNTDDIGVLGQNVTVTERGAYICRARYPGKEFDVISNKIIVEIDDEGTLTIVAPTASNKSAAAARPFTAFIVFIFLTTVLVTLTTWRLSGSLLNRCGNL